ncbi:MAG: YwaF family protein [Clostridiales bacterium]|jgi:uncharacterized membrane protein YwaF|nr:YwaF family protein [Clostridiales bacterium]
MFFNDAPIYVVPNLFSYQHVLLLFIGAGYVVGLSLLMRRVKPKTQDRIYLAVCAVMVTLFFGRLFLGYDNIFQDTFWNADKDWTTLAPLQLCNLLIYFCPVVVILKKKRLYNTLYYFALAPLTALLIFPPVHMNLNLFAEYMFFDYFIIHINIMAIAISLPVSGRFVPSLKAAAFNWVYFLAAGLFIFIITAILRNFDHFRTASYFWTFGPAGLPVLTQLYAFFGELPFIYLLPVAIIILALNLLMWLPFLKKRDRKARLK